MKNDDRVALAMVFQSFRHVGGNRVQQHLLYRDLHELLWWCDQHPESVERVA